MAMESAMVQHVNARVTKAGLVLVVTFPIVLERPIVITVDSAIQPSSPPHVLAVYMDGWDQGALTLVFLENKSRQTVVYVNAGLDFQGKDVTVNVQSMA